VLPAGGVDPSGGMTTCYRHPQRRTALRCPQCQRPACAECLVPTPVGLLCPDDAAVVTHGVGRLGTFVGANAMRVPIVSYTLIAINVAVYFATALSQGGTVEDNEQSKLFHDLVLSPYLVGSEHEYYRMITAAFLHIGPVHLLFNMVALGMLGPGLERLIGWWRFLSIYLVAALGGSVAVLLFGPVLGGVAGASGAIFGLFAAALVLARVIGFDTRSLWITVLLNFVITYTVPGISKLGHVGGFLFGGLACGAILEWTLQRRPPESRRVDRQITGLIGLVGVLIMFSAYKVYDIRQLVPTQ